MTHDLLLLFYESDNAFAYDFFRQVKFNTNNTVLFLFFWRVICFHIGRFCFVDIFGRVATY